jgi:hypothetical protein
MKKTVNRHIAKPLFGLSNRRKQPERYAQWGLKWLENIKIKKLLENT